MLKRFYVLLHGKNFKIPVNGTDKPVSFFTTRYIYSSDEDYAKEKAIAMVFKEPRIKSCLNTKDDIPVLSIKEIKEVHFMTAILRQPKGYSFYITDKSVPDTQIYTVSY